MNHCFLQFIWKPCLGINKEEMSLKSVIIIIFLKAPLRESATDLVCMSMETHFRSVTIAQGGCRVLANLATTLYTVVNNKLDNSKWCFMDL